MTCHHGCGCTQLSDIDRNWKVVKDTEMDYECELAVVIGKPCKNVSEADALDYVLGADVLTQSGFTTTSHMS